jgi:hypothetical protein
MKNFYYLASSTENGKNYAFVIKTTDCNNLLYVLSQYKGLKTVTPCETKKEAESRATEWNARYKANGTYLFD